MLNVKDSQFGAVGDGATDDTLAIQSAIDYANSRGGNKVYFPKGVYLVTGLTVYSNIWLTGDGRDNTTIRLKDGSNTDLIYGDKSNERWLSNITEGVTNFGLVDISLHGNRANNTSGSCVAVYGDDMYWQNVFISGAADWGIRTDFYDTNNAFGMEGNFVNIKVENCGKDGWRFDGPHDSVIINATIIDCGQKANNTYDGIKIGPRTNGRFIGCHVWNRSYAARHRYAVNIMDGGGGNEFTACHFEGAYSANVRIACSNNLFDASTRIYYPWNGINILMCGTSTLNTINCRISGPFAGLPDSYAVVLGAVAGDYVASNFLNFTSVENKLGAMWFFHSDGGNRVKVEGYQSSGSSIAGNYHPSDRVDIFCQGATVPSIKNI